MQTSEPRSLKTRAYKTDQLLRDRAARRMARCAPDVVTHLPDPQVVRIDVNGCLAGMVTAVPHALEELAAGWAFLNGFFDTASELGKVTAHGARVSIMVSSGEDVDRRRLEAVGWAERTPLPDPGREEDTPAILDEADVIDVIDAAWHAFRGNGLAEGYAHAAIASEVEIWCLAQDVSADVAVAKVIGWMLLHGREHDTSILVINGLVRRDFVEAAARLGIAIVASPVLATAEAFRAATGCGVSLVGLALDDTAAILVDNGHIMRDAAWRPGADPEG